MPNPLITLSLAPFLILQGRHVRRVTPRLPEPDGARAGQAGSGQPLRLLIIGDSAAAGVGVSQMALQDSFGRLNTRFTLEQLIGEGVKNRLPS